MKYAKRWADLPDSCFNAGRSSKPVHEVTAVAGPDGAHETGFFAVKSGRSGIVYHVTPNGECTCDGYSNRHTCSHLEAVLEFARRVLDDRPESLPN